MKLHLSLCGVMAVKDSLKLTQQGVGASLCNDIDKESSASGARRLMLSCLIGKKDLVNTFLFSISLINCYVNCQHHTCVNTIIVVKLISLTSFTKLLDIWSIGLRKIGPNN